VFLKFRKMAVASWSPTFCSKSRLNVPRVSTFLKTTLKRHAIKAKALEVQTATIFPARGMAWTVAIFGEASTCKKICTEVWTGEMDPRIALIRDELRVNIERMSSDQRVFHGRGGCFEGLECLALDSIGNNLLVTSYAEEEESFWEALTKLINEEFANMWQNIYLQNRPRSFSWITLCGMPQDYLDVAENGLKYRVNLDSVQNLGFFFDMKVGRSFVRGNAKNGKVLNMFAYTCSLSVAAIGGGANEVVNIDMAKNALAKGRDNHRLNGQKFQNVKFLSHDILKSFGSLVKKGPFNLIIVDPPSNQGKSFYVEKDYAKVVRRLPEMLAPDGVVMACLNAVHLQDDFLRELFAANGFVFERKLENPPEFREKNDSLGLKVHVYKYCSRVEAK